MKMRSLEETVSMVKGYTDFPKLGVLGFPDNPAGGGVAD
jgi:hypothetical protein